MLSPMSRIAIIGGGSMGEALLSGLLRAGRQVKDMVVAEKFGDRAKFLAEKYSVQVTSVAAAAESATYVVIAVKPADVEKVIDEIADAAVRADSDTAEQVFVSIAAGVATSYYENKLPAGSPVIRVMPNSPIVVGGDQCAGAGPVCHRGPAQGGLVDLRRGRRCDHRRRVAAGCGDRGFRLGPGVFLPDGRGAGRCGRGIGSVACGVDRSGGADDGGLGGDAAGTPRRGECGRRRRAGHHTGPIAGDGDLAGRDHRRWAAGT